MMLMSTARICHNFQGLGRVHILKIISNPPFHQIFTGDVSVRRALSLQLQVCSDVTGDSAGNHLRTGSYFTPYYHTVHILIG